MQKHKKPSKRRAGICAALAVCAVFLVAGVANAQLVHRYSFTASDGTTVTDSVSSAHGTLINGSGGSTFAGGLLNLNNDGVENSTAADIDYVDLPNGIVSALTPSATFEAWVIWDGGDIWQRVYDLGTSNGGENDSGGADNAYYTILCPEDSGGTIRAELACVLGEANQWLNTPAAMAIGTPVHVAAALDEANALYTLYLNGEVVNYLTVQDFALSKLTDNNNWLGRSQWPDTMFDGAYDEFRLYTDALTAGEIMGSYLAGPDVLGAGSLGDPIAATLVGPTTMALGGIEQFHVELDYVGASDVVVYTDAIVQYSSSDPGVLTVTDNGLVEGVDFGSATIQVIYGPVTNSLLVEVVPLPAYLKHRWSFNSDAGYVEPGTEEDLVGSADGDVWSGTYTGLATTNNPGNLLLESGDFGYVDLPNHIISAMTNATVELWATPLDAGGDWQRFWDFGTTAYTNPPTGEMGPEYPVPGAAGLDYWFLSAKVGGGFTSRLQTNPPGGDEGHVDAARVETPGGIVTRGEEHHLVAVYNAAGNQMSLYMNGQLIGTDTGATMELADLPDYNVWLGRSNWTYDDFVSAYYNEVRIHEGVLGPAQIGVSYQAGPDTYVEDPGTPTGLSIEVPTNVLQYLGLGVDANVVADFGVYTNVTIDGERGVEWGSGDTNVVTVSGTGFISPVGIGSTTVSVSYEGFSTNITMSVAEYVVAPTLAHRYSFNEADGSAFAGSTVTDSVGGVHGTVQDIGGVYTGGQLSLPGGPPNGDDAFVDLPNGILSSMGEQVTLECWITATEVTTWTRAFSFGSSEQGENLSGTGVDWVDLIPQVGGSGLLSFDMAESGQGTGICQSPGAFPAGVEVHVVGVVDTISGVNRLYMDGQFITAAPILGGFTLANVNDINCWLGRGQWGDPRFNGLFNEFRMYTGLMSESEVAASYAAGPDMGEGEPPVITDFGISGGGTAADLTWTSESGSNYTISRSTDVTAGEPSWSPVKTGIAGAADSTSDSVATGGGDVEAYRVEME